MSTDVHQFWTWVEETRGSLGLSYRAIERTRGLSHGTISRRALNLQEPTLDGMRAIAKAFGITLIHVLIEAGIAPPDPKISPPLRDAMFLFSSLEEETQDIALVLLRALLERQRRVWEALARG